MELEVRPDLDDISVIQEFRWGRVGMGNNELAIEVCAVERASVSNVDQRRVFFIVINVDDIKLAVVA